MNQNPLGPTSRVSDAISLDEVQKLAFLTNFQVMPLVQGAHFENSSRAKSFKLVFLTI